MSFRLLITASLCCMILTGCAHGPCNALGSLFGCACTAKRPQPEFEDLTIKPPDFDGGLQADVDVDGYTLQAIRVAADDFLDPDPNVVPCRAKQVSHSYQARREGDIIFVRIDFKPANCGREFGVLDGGATYAVSVDGRILRRFIDGMVPYEEKRAPPDTGIKDDGLTPAQPPDQAVPTSPQDKASVDTPSAPL